MSSRRAPHDTSATNPVTAYAKAVVSGAQLAGRAVRLACERHLRDLKDGPARGLRFDRAAVTRILKFCAALRMPESGEPFRPLPWQQFVLGSLFGWMVRDGDGWRRRFRGGYLEIGKGAGKTPMGAAVAAYGLVADDEDGAQVLLGGTKKEQAQIAFADSSKMVERSPMLARLVERNLTTLSVPSTGSVLRAVSSEARTLDGWRGHIIIVDELHEHSDPSVLLKLSASTKGRRQPLVLALTNAGHDRTSICWAQHVYALEMLEGTRTDDTFFAYVCQLDACAECRAAGHVAPVDGCEQCDSWKNERTWVKTNPSLPTTPTIEYLRAQVREATGMPARESLVRRLNFCEWLQSFSRWLDLDAWNGCHEEFTDEDLEGLPCFGGLDLGQSDDFSAFVRIWLVEDGRVVVKPRFWIPESALEKYPTRPYDVWGRAGALTVTAGAVADLDQIEEELVELCRAFGVVDCGYDKRFASQMAQHLEGAGLTVTDVPQGFGLNEPLMRLHDLVAGRRLVHDGNPVMTWMAGNAIVRHGMRSEIRLDKENSGDKIDGIAALATALSRALAGPPDVPEPRISVLG